MFEEILSEKEMAYILKEIEEEMLKDVKEEKSWSEIWKIMPD